jgi:hypothetical protein
MAIAEQLRRDEERVREELQILEEALRMAPTANTIRLVCVSLGHALDEHLRTKTELLTTFANFRANASQQPEDDESGLESEETPLQEAEALLVMGVKLPASTAAAHLIKLCEVLREQLSWEEREVVPAIEVAERIRSIS